jgi:Zn-dependent peptidase ImmA (M78 family)
MDTEHWDIIRAHQRAWPVQMVPLASDLGVKVYRVDAWPDNVNGRIYKSALRGGHAGYAIDVNDAHHEVRRRYTIAHEIANFLLHRQYIGGGIYHDALYRSGLPSAMETQANKLAAEILMPHHLLTAAMNQGIRSPEALARAFQVSEAAMQIRLGTA